MRSITGYQSRIRLVRSSTSSAPAPERRGDGGADDPDTGKFGADTADDVPHARLDRLDRGIAVLAEIVDAFEPDDRRNAGQRQYIAVEPVLGRRSAGKRLSRRVRGRPHHLVAADAGIDHGNIVAVKRMQSAGEHVRPAIVAVH